MHKNKRASEIAQQLGLAVEQLHQDLLRVEIWAGALSGFASPVPDYGPSDKFSLPPHSPPKDEVRRSRRRQIRRG